MNDNTRPEKPYRSRVLLLGGTSIPSSVTERVLTLAADFVSECGADAVVLAGSDLTLPMYAPENPARSDKAQRLIKEIRDADALIIAGYGYHGALSGMLKNALDYIEDTAKDPVPYLQDRAVGLIGTAKTWQDVGSVMISLRAVVHALRGWPTPLGVAVNTLEQREAPEESAVPSNVTQQLRVLAHQVVAFSKYKNDGALLQLTATH